MTSNQSILKNLSKIDPVMSELIKHIGPIDLEPRRLPPFQSIIHAIIHQQLSGHVAGAIYNRFVLLFEKGKFPTPEQIKEIDFEIMRGAGLSKPKTVYIKDVAEMALMGLV
jgi:DNA-3-methyladenine glycosylase II